MQTQLDAPFDRIWDEVNRSRLLQYVAWSLVRFQSVDPSGLPAEWLPGKYEVHMLVFGVLPLGRQWIVISHPQTELPIRELLDDGHGQIITQWRHLIRVEPVGSKSTCYTDNLNVRAGLLTPIVWLWAVMFYAHRQRRWRKLVESNFSYQ